MKLRDALREQAPSLALQRAAADEIARLDAEVISLRARMPPECTCAAVDMPFGRCCKAPCAKAVREGLSK